MATDEEAIAMLRIALQHYGAEADIDYDPEHLATYRRASQILESLEQEE